MKGIGPEPVHISVFESCCVDFANDALDPNDPSGWQAAAQASQWGDPADDGVAFNVKVLQNLMLSMGRYVLIVRIKGVFPAARKGNSKMRDRGKERQRQSETERCALKTVPVSVHLKVGSLSHRTEFKEMECGTAVFNEEACFRYIGEDKVDLKVYEGGPHCNSVLGDAELHLDKSMLHTTEIRCLDVMLYRGDEPTGQLLLHYTYEDCRRPVSDVNDEFD